MEIRTLRVSSDFATSWPHHIREVRQNMQQTDRRLPMRLINVTMSNQLQFELATVCDSNDNSLRLKLAAISTEFVFKVKLDH